jgi:hypothetical protein
MNAKLENLWNRLPESIRDQKQKIGLLTALLSILAMAVAWQTLGGAAAKTAAAKQGATVDSKKSVEERATASTSRKSSKKQKDLESWLARPIEPITRDLFAYDLSRFPFASLYAQSSPDAPRAVTVWDRAEKSLNARADALKQTESRRSSLIRAAERLNVQSIMSSGSTSTAMVNGRVLRVGEIVEDESAPVKVSFVVRAIEGRRLIVERDGVRIAVSIRGDVDPVKLID